MNRREKYDLRPKGKGVEILQDTLDRIEKRNYIYQGEEIKFKLSKLQMEEATVYLPEKIYEFFESYEEFRQDKTHCNIYVKNVDTFFAVKEMYESDNIEGMVAALNFANPFRPGGGVRAGALQQEETLCLRSTLLKSLESVKASEYYIYNNSPRTFAGNDCLIVSENVEVFKDSDYKYMKETFPVSVITCAAPIVSPFSHRLEDTTEAQMEILLYRRIMTVLVTCIIHNYRNLVLGAWGCNSFGNDAKVMARLFKQALEDIEAERYFNHICFAIRIANDSNDYNLRAFQDIFEKR